MEQSDHHLTIRQWSGATWTLPFEQSITIDQIKCRVARILSSFPEELTFMIGPDYPYALASNLKIHDLLPEHRTLYVLVTERPRECPPSRLVDSECRLRLDRDLSESDLQHIWCWLTSCHVKHVVLDAESEQLDSIVQTLKEGIDLAFEDVPRFLPKTIIGVYRGSIEDVEPRWTTLVSGFKHDMQHYQYVQRLPWTLVSYADLPALV